MQGGDPAEPALQGRRGSGPITRGAETTARRDAPALRAEAEPGIPQLWTLFVCQCALISGYALSFPFMALYLHRERGIPMGWVGAALGASMLFGSLAQALGGELSDIVGRKAVMRLSLSLRALTVGLLAFAVWKRWPVPLMLAVLYVSGFCGHFFDPASRGWVADRCGPRERARAYGLLRIAGNAGWAIGPAIGGTLAAGSYPLMFLATAIVCSFCALLVTFGIREAPALRPEERFSFGGILKAGREARFLAVCALSLVLGTVQSQLVVSLSVHSTQFVGVSESQVGLLFSLNGVLVVALQYFATRRWSAYPLTASLAAGSLLYAAGYAFVGLAGAFAALIAAVTIVTLGEITVAPALQSLWANMAPAREKGRYVGFAGFSRDVGFALGPLLGGLALQHASPRFPPGPWLAVAIVGTVAAAGFHLLAGRLSAEEQGLEESLAGPTKEPAKETA